MSTLMILALVVGSLLAVGVCRVVTGHVAWRISDTYGQKKPDGSDWCVAFFAGVVVVLVLPVAAVWMLAGRRWSVGAESRARARIRDRRIRELEKELDLR